MGGKNVVLERCNSQEYETFDAKSHCVSDFVASGLPGLSTEAGRAQNMVSSMLHDRHQTLTKFRIEIAGIIDVTFAEHVSRDDMWNAKLFGSQVSFMWDQWEFQLFEIYGGDLKKKVGTSGSIDKHEVCSPDSTHTACIKDPCANTHEHTERGCVIEFPDWFAHA